MLAYNDPRWKELEGGYKMLYDPTPALKELEFGEDADWAWEELWNELHHQGDIGEASYAAVPHLVRIYKERSDRDWNLYGLVSTIEIERHRKTNPPVPNWLESSYREAWETLLKLALSDISSFSDESSVKQVLGTIALSKGLVKVGTLISHFGDSELIEFLDEQMSWSELYR